MEVKHTPLPWEVCNGIDIYPVGDVQARHYVANVDPDNAPFEGGVSRDTDSTYQMKMADAEFIVRACNSHYDLLEALTTFVAEYVALVESGDAGFWDPEKEAKVIAARVAISKAGGR